MGRRWSTRSPSRRQRARAVRERWRKDRRSKSRTGRSSMSAELIARNPDLKRLRDEGYLVAIRGSSLLVREVPYVTERREVKRGILVSPLDLAGDITIRP